MFKVGALVMGGHIWHVITIVTCGQPHLQPKIGIMWLFYQNYHQLSKVSMVQPKLGLIWGMYYIYGALHKWYQQNYWDFGSPCQYQIHATSLPIWVTPLPISGAVIYVNVNDAMLLLSFVTLHTHGAKADLTIGLKLSTCTSCTRDSRQRDRMFFSLSHFRIYKYLVGEF